jgi:hypothetical protein
VSIILTGLTFENPGQPDDKRFTVYDLEIVEKEKGFQSTFIIRKSETFEGKGSPITEDLILNTVSAMVDRSKKLNGLQVLEDGQGLQVHQVRIYAERRDGDFDKCSFREYRPTIAAKPEIDFTKEGGSKIRVSKEYVEQQVADIESWKQREPEHKWDEMTLTDPRKIEIVPNPNIKQERNQEREREREPER